MDGCYRASSSHLILVFILTVPGVILFGAHFEASHSGLQAGRDRTRENIQYCRETEIVPQTDTNVFPYLKSCLVLSHVLKEANTLEMFQQVVLVRQSRYLPGGGRRCHFRGRG